MVVLREGRMIRVSRFSPIIDASIAARAEMESAFAQKGTGVFQRNWRSPAVSVIRKEAGAQLHVKMGAR
jgi:hypothetical protein